MAKNRHQRAKGRLFDRQNGLCAYCDTPMTFGQEPTMCTLDHVIPLSKGGTDEESNMVAACWQCNRLKGALSVEQIRQIADRIEKLTAPLSAAA